MNKKLLVTTSGFFLAAAISTASQAMELSAKGIEVGLNMGSASGADADISGAEKQMRMGMAVGGFVKLDLNDKLSLRPEILYVQKGVSYEAGSVQTHNRLSYIDIPVMLEFGVLKGNMPVNLFGGVNVAILLSAESEVSGGGVGVDGTTDIKDNLNTLDYGLQFGVGTIINKHISVDARYSLGLASTDKNGDLDAKNSGFMLTGGYMF